MNEAEQKVADLLLKDASDKELTQAYRSQCIADYLQLLSAVQSRVCIESSKKE